MKVVKINNIKLKSGYQLRFYIKGSNKYFVLGDLNIGFVFLYDKLSFYDKEYEVFYTKKHFLIISMND